MKLYFVGSGHFLIRQNTKKDPKKEKKTYHINFFCFTCVNQAISCVSCCFQYGRWSFWQASSQQIQGKNLEFALYPWFLHQKLSFSHKASKIKILFHTKLYTKGSGCFFEKTKKDPKKERKPRISAISISFVFLVLTIDYYIYWTGRKKSPYASWGLGIKVRTYNFHISQYF